MIKRNSHDWLISTLDYFRTWNKFLEFNWAAHIFLIAQTITMQIICASSLFCERGEVMTIGRKSNQLFNLPNRTRGTQTSSEEDSHNFSSFKFFSQFKFSRRRSKSFQVILCIGWNLCDSSEFPLISNQHWWRRLFFVSYFYIHMTINAFRTLSIFECSFITPAYRTLGL